MKNLKYIGYLCLVVVLAAEIGAIIGNLFEGESIFYLFSLSDRFSVDNTPTFLAYWGSLIGVFYFVRDFGSFKTLRQFIPHSNKSGYKSSSTIQDELSEIEDLYKKSIITKEEKNEMRSRALDIKGFSSSETLNESNAVPSKKTEPKRKAYTSGAAFLESSTVDSISSPAVGLLLFLPPWFAWYKYGFSWWRILLFLFLGFLALVCFYICLEWIAKKLYDPPRTVTDLTTQPNDSPKTAIGRAAQPVYQNQSPKQSSMKVSENLEKFLKEKNIPLSKFKRDAAFWVVRYENWLKTNEEKTK